MNRFAPAKINLFLAIDSKRQDGYHVLRTILHKITLADVLGMKASQTTSLLTEGLPIPTEGDNLCEKAVRLYAQAFGTSGASIFLDKRIPIGAGLGGGSSDAAAALLSMQEMYAKAGEEELSHLAAKLGADVPFFLKGQTALARGIGTELTPLPSIDLGWIVLLKPKSSLSTRDVYAELRPEDYAVKPDIEPMLRAVATGNRQEIYAHLFNHLEAPAFRILPELVCLKKKLFALGGATLLSGSGSTIFSLFECEEDALSAIKKLKTDVDWSGLFRSGENDEED